MHESHHMCVEACLGVYHVTCQCVPYERVESHMDGACHICRSHITYECVTARMNESYHIRMGPVTYAWTFSHVSDSDLYISKETYVSQKRPIYLKRGICMNHFTREWLRPVHIKRDLCISKETYILEKRHMHESLHTWVTQMHTLISCHKYTSTLISRHT